MWCYMPKESWATLHDLSLGFMNSEAATASSGSTVNKAFIEDLQQELSTSSR